MPSDHLFVFRPTSCDNHRQIRPTPLIQIMKLTRDLVSQKLLELSGFFVLFALGALGILIAFSEGYEYRWVILGLVAILFALDAITHFKSSWHDSIWTQRLLMALMTLNTVALLAVPPHIDIFVIVFFVLSVTAAMLFEPKEWTAWIAGFVVLTFLYYLNVHSLQDGMIMAIVYAGAYYFFATFAKSMSDANKAEAESKQLLSELQDAHQQLQAYADQVEELTIVDERNRMAREMHDTVGHRLTVSAVQLEAAQRLITKDSARAEQMVGTVREQIGEALNELRQTVAALRAPLEEDLRLDVSLQRLAEQFRQGTGLKVEVETPDDLPVLEPQQRQAIYRAAQESLTNIQRHAQATNVWMQLQRQENGIVLYVSDDGIGIPPKLNADGFGLRGLRERASQLGGDFQLSPRPGGGSQAIFHIPLTAEQNHD